MLGTAEVKTNVGSALRRIGKQNDQGETVGIAYLERGTLQMIPVVLRILGFILVLSLYFLQRPLAVFGAASDLVPGLERFADTQFISPWQYGLAVVIYGVYFMATLVRSGFFKGQPGVELHFTKHQRIVRTLKAGKSTLVLDPRVRPYAAVSTKPFVLDMPQIEGTTGDNISLSYKGALIAQVEDTYRLVERGGFDTFCTQLSELFESVIKDEMLSISARDFNRFLVERATFPIEAANEGGSLTDRLVDLEKEDLSPELLSKIASIAELDVSRFMLHEAEFPRRRALLDKLQDLASSYGITLLDHLPQGNLTSDDYLRTLAVGLVSSITRVRQATETLKDITEEEISEEIAAKVADVSLGVLEVERIIREIDAIKGSLQDGATETQIIRARQAAIDNIVSSYLIPALSQVSTLKEQVRARSVQSAGLETYIQKQDDLLTRLEEQLGSLPRVRRVVTDQTAVRQVVMQGDLLGSLLQESDVMGTLQEYKQRGLARLASSDQDALEAYRLDVDTLMAQLSRALEDVATDSGTHIEYTPESVKRKVEAITAKSVPGTADTQTHGDAVVNTYKVADTTTETAKDTTTDREEASV